MEKNYKMATLKDYLSDIEREENQKAQQMQISLNKFLNLSKADRNAQLLEDLLA